MQPTIAIKTEGLTKFYGSFQALYGVDLEVRRGEIFGFLGPNGAGKTTTIRCMLDLIHRSGGLIEVLGVDPAIDPISVQERVGYLPGELHLDANLTPEKLFRFLNKLRRGEADWRFVNELAERLDLPINRPIKNLSHGNKQKIGVVQAMMHRPEVLLLDEPTVGLDPLMQQEVLILLNELRDGGSTIFFSSHIMSEVESVADRVAIVRKGVIVETAETEGLIKRSMRKVRVRFNQDIDSVKITQIPGVELLSRDDGNILLLQVSGEMDALIKAVAEYQVLDFDSEYLSLEEVFLTYYHDDVKETDGYENNIPV